MKELKTRHKVAAWVLLITIALSVMILFLPTEQVITTYKNVNGVVTIKTVPKIQGVLTMVLTPFVVCLIWEFFARRHDRKMEEEPELLSLRLRAAGLNFYCFILSCIGIIVGIVNIVEWIKTLT